MREYISREAAIALADGGCHPANVAKEIAKLPAADVVEVVRCKDCLNWKRDAYGGVCDRYGVRLDGDWFCAG